MMWRLNDAILNGNGVGKPVGILGHAALVTQAKENNQAAGSLTAGNINAMFARMPASIRRNAVWVMNQDLEAQLGGLTIGTVPVYLPSGGLVDAPNGLLKGRPIIYSEATAEVGKPGDISLIDFRQYLTLVKTPGVRSDVSIHLWFDQGISAYRFSMRIGGMPWWSKPLTRPGSKQAQSYAIALAERA
jgi:HK97 family phage major capsid protein